MNRNTLFQNILRKRSFLCIGLDSDPLRLPEHLLDDEDPLYSFNRAIIEATHDLCVAYKPNLAFYEASGAKGWTSLERSMSIVPRDVFTIADAKRGDIGNTSQLYARAFFENMNFDAVTVAPYMGHDSVKPFIGFPGKWVVLLALTSNPGAHDFQLSKDADGIPLFERVMREAMEWAGPDELMFVCGATRSEQFSHLRQIAPDHFFLVPGVGAQGGDLAAVARTGMNAQCGLLVNSSRQILYASSGRDFAEAARAEATKVRDEMDSLLAERGW
ncbi:MAG: orotidine-5'-phosphate decarboxylase [Sphingobacteriales bacterium]|nr:orotidine-5'-phosphate decarboxylase [Sphingobacteriales bacterium]